LTLTKKQIAFLEAIRKGGKNDVASLNQILENLSYETKKDSLHFTIKYLVKKGLIEKRELRKFTGGTHLERPIALTAAGKDVANRYCKSGAATPLLSDFYGAPSSIPQGLEDCG